MKTPLFLFSLLFLVSCKKDFVCRCETSTSNWDTSLFEKRKRQARKQCELTEETFKLENPSVSCELIIAN